MLPAGRIPTEPLHLHAFLPRCHHVSVERLIDPTTGSYTGTRTATLSNAVYLRLTIPLGSYWADPSMGSKLHLLMREKDVRRIRILAQQYAEQALAPLTSDADGRAKSVTVEPLSSEPGWLLLHVTVTQANDEKTTFKHPVRIA
jgi:phage gp46-like protein